VLRELQDDSLEPVLDRHPSATVKHRTMFGEPARSPIEASSGCGLVVVGAGRSGLLGSVGTHFVRHAAAPVAAVPSRSDS
jgi:nucleotide-binding universal stress UspA family protein